MLIELFIKVYFVSKIFHIYTEIRLNRFSGLAVKRKRQTDGVTFDYTILVR